jgi:hypothetical protein
VIESNATAVNGEAYGGPVTLANANGTAVSIVATGATNASVDFLGAVDGTVLGQQGLLVNGGASGRAIFGSTVGGAVPLASVAATGNAILVDGNISTGGPQSYTGPVTMSGVATTLNSNANAGNGPIDFTGAIDGLTALTVNAGLGPVTFGGTIGGATPLVSLGVTGPTTLAGNVTTSRGGQAYHDTLVLQGNTSLTDLSNGPISFGGTVDAATTGGASLAVNDGTAVVTFGGAVGATRPLASLAVTDPVIDANITTIGSQTYNGAVTLGNANGTTVTLATGGAAGANIALNSPVNGTISGQQGLIVNAGAAGNVTFGGTVGATVPLASLAATGNALSLGGAVTTTGALGLAATGSGLTIPVALNAGGTATLAAAGAITEPAGGAITAANLVASTQLDAGGAITLNRPGNIIPGAVTLSSLNTLGSGLAGGAIDFADGISFTITSLGGPLSGGLATTGAVTAVSAGTVAAPRSAGGAPGSLTIASGATVTGSGVVLAAVGNFVNNAGAGAVSATGGGRWLIYSSAPAGDTFGSLNSNNTAIWGATFASLPPASVTRAGNRYLFAQTQTLTITTTNVGKTYGTDATAAVAAAFTPSGFAPGVAGAFLGDTAATVFSGAPAVTSSGAATTASVAGGPYPIVATAGSLAVANGYTLAFANTGLLSITPATLTAGLAGTVSKIYDGTTVATLAAANYTLTGVVNGDSVSLNDPAAGTYASANVGTGLNVGVSGLAISGAGAGNYVLASSATNAAIGTITPASLTAAIIGNPSKIYDGTTAAPLLPGNFLLSGFVAGQGATVTPLSGTYATANADSGIAVSANLGTAALTAAAGTLLGNYTLPATAAGTGTITARPLTVTADDLTRPSGQPNPPLTYTVTSGSLVSGDSLSGMLATIANSSSPGGTYPITQGSLAATPNYALGFIDGTLTVTSLLNFGASPNKYIPSVTELLTPQPGLTPCSPATLAATLASSGSVALFGASSGTCGGS